MNADPALLQLAVIQEKIYTPLAQTKSDTSRKEHSKWLTTRKEFKRGPSGGKSTLPQGGTSLYTLQTYTIEGEVPALIDETIWDTDSETRRWLVNGKWKTTTQSLKD